MEAGIISPPANFGALKRGLFKLGVRAYGKPAGLGRKLYDAGAVVAGVPLAFCNPYYDWGGVRREVQVALGQEKGAPPDLKVLMEEDQAKRLFHPQFVTGSSDQRLFELAWLNVLFRMSEVARRRYYLIASALSLAIFGTWARQNFQYHHPYCGGLFLLAGAAISRGIFQLVSKPQKVIGALCDYLVVMDRATLRENIVHMMVPSTVARWFNRELLTRGGRDPDFVRTTAKIKFGD
jgi:hypothetical protein